MPAAQQWGGKKHPGFVFCVISQKSQYPKYLLCNITANKHVSHVSFLFKDVSCLAADHATPLVLSFPGGFEKSWRLQPRSAAKSPKSLASRSSVHSHQQVSASARKGMERYKRYFVVFSCTFWSWESMCAPKKRLKGFYSLRD